MLLRASDLLAEDNCKVHAVHCWKGENVIICSSEREVTRERSPGVDTVEVRSRGSQGDQGRNVTILARMKYDGDKTSEAVKLL